MISFSFRYVDGLLKDHGITFLANLDSQMGAQKKSLDSAMQMLVYENYNKFIDATDKMKEMKENVERMEGEMDELLAKVTHIATTCEEVTFHAFTHRKP